MNVVLFQEVDGQYSSICQKSIHVGERYKLMVLLSLVWGNPSANA